MRVRDLKSKHFVVAAGVLWLILLGLYAATSEGIVPETPMQWLFVLLIGGPLLVAGESILEVAFYAIGRLTLHVLSLGRVRPAAPANEQALPWHGTARLPEGRIVVSNNFITFFGFVLVALTFAVSLVVAWTHAA